MSVVFAPGSAYGPSVTARYFGTGNGTRTVFNLAGMDSDRAYLMPVLFKQDWGGVQQLYSTPRTNLILWSNDITNAAWTKRGTTVAALTAHGPDGGTNNATNIQGYFYSKPLPAAQFEVFAENAKLALSKL